MTIQIIPFENRYQEAICNMMDQIQDEFDIPFRNPHGKQISDIVDSENRFWIALDGDHVLGTIGLSRIKPGHAFLRHLFVAKEGRGETGTAKLLLDTALQEAKKLHYTHIYLGTMEQFKAAQKFYAKNQFICIPKEALPAEMPVSPMDTLFYLLKNESN
ncbi:GNAT family N-acetyltransferase [Fluviicola sp.]|uniref:GNAT family N-acetyltransferase n=1 Tax=Fluviicola sp. TaxID=1917219 RepID=UPI0031D5A809